MVQEESLSAVFCNVTVTSSEFLGHSSLISGQRGSAEHSGYPPTSPERTIKINHLAEAARGFQVHRYILDLHSSDFQEFLG
jgi:hypothetical protein